MRTKLISVSKFSRKKKRKEKSRSCLIVLVSSPVLRECSVFVFTAVLFLNTGVRIVHVNPGLSERGRKEEHLCFRWSSLCFDCERPADRSSPASLQ